MIVLAARPPSVQLDKGGGSFFDRRERGCRDWRGLTDFGVDQSKVALDVLFERLNGFYELARSIWYISRHKDSALASPSEASAHLMAVNDQSMSFSLRFGYNTTFRQRVPLQLGKGVFLPDPENKLCREYVKRDLVRRLFALVGKPIWNARRVTFHVPGDIASGRLTLNYSAVNVFVTKKSQVTVIGGSPVSRVETLQPHISYFAPSCLTGQPKLNVASADPCGRLGGVRISLRSWQRHHGMLRIVTSWKASYTINVEAHQQYRMRFAQDQVVTDSEIYEIRNAKILGASNSSWELESGVKMESWTVDQYEDSSRLQHLQHKINNSSLSFQQFH
ncbi:uncharacterized protein BDR25DRAFT_354195 [Lindgomyces ingoldianus]|uniref:Uncharacterized protein n=1 Tax=Lindgomyces ingoldianus TaxID=673940 RepID=A0ACB6R031_9PLEO|nr:uncharacterized protein BDR25DRAFT_354195 [Lindgomyces ingoldianus]KAF2471697.1 hypothetical protein BDR25DRAFT_354195 [Lindgomyces ingoldianus]